MKYHIPKEEELFDGYEFELQVYDYKNYEYIDEWEKNVFDVRSGLGHDEYHTFTEGRVRVKKFELSDLAVFGYKETEFGNWRKGDCYIEEYENDTYWIGDFKQRMNCDGDLFLGKIPTLNDFKKLKQYIDRIQ